MIQYHRRVLDEHGNAIGFAPMTPEEAAGVDPQWVAVDGDAAGTYLVPYTPAMIAERKALTAARESAHAPAAKFD